MLEYVLRPGLHSIRGTVKFYVMRFKVPVIAANGILLRHFFSHLLGGLFLLFPASGRCEPPAIIDLSVLVSEDLPGTWPSAGWPPYQIHHYRRIGPLSAYNSDILIIDGNTGTQLDVPPHSIPRPGSKLRDAGPFGEMFTDKAPAWQFGGEACVIDVRDLLDKGA